MADHVSRGQGLVPLLLSVAIAGGVIGPLLGVPTPFDVFLVVLPGLAALGFVLADLRLRPRLTRGVAGLGARLARSRSAAVVVLGSNGESSYWNRGAEEIFGLPPARGVPRELAKELVPEDRREDFLAEVSRALSEGRDPTPRRRSFRDGAGRVFEAVSTLCPAGGEVALVLLDGRGSEVSAERRGRLADHLPAGILHLDPWGRVAAVSPRLANWVGRTPELLEGLDASQLEFFSERIRSLLVGLAMRRGYGREEVFEDETRVTAPDGSRRHLLAVISARPGGGVDALFLETAGSTTRSVSGHGGVLPAAGAPPTYGSTASVPAGAASPAGSPAPGEGTGAEQKPRVLFVEDNDEIRDLIALVLRSRGVDVTPCATGPQAIELFAGARGSFALVLLDLSLPGMDGFEIHRAIRALPFGTGTPIVALTAYASEFDRERAMAERMDDFVPKPVTRSMIDELLRRWVFRGPAR